ncbi:hypothetical protein AOQ72_04975 [Bradyrhizobium yuanmingense]|uniref:Uncharacterized protein n=2 Tax=Bradyrhizobium yuanmingense TaxID=108015 RepID=A0A0R3BHZ2_9BRAD|nr:hypothetical protein AOQ72_04975 [Bradyrhizobium yuanmingense]
MRKADKRELMIRWFHQNYEDPVNETPIDSGEFIYIWGGPYDARDELFAKFGYIVPEELIEEVAQDVEQNGVYNWAPVQTGDDHDDIPGVDDDDDEPPSLDIYFDEPSDRYGSPEELEARKQALTAIQRLEKIIEKRREIGIGHNKPPEEVEEGPNEPELREAVQELKIEFRVERPAIPTVKKYAKRLRDVLVAAAKWAGKKADKAADAAAAVIGTGGGGYILSQYVPPVHHAFEAIIKWLEVAAKSLF